jgi:CheY-like chemotaxis protein
MARRPQIVTFNFNCSQSQVWVSIVSETLPPQTIEMRQTFPNCWTASAWLVPGQYFCRYYSGDDRNVVYQGPAKLIGVEPDSLTDGLVSIDVPHRSTGAASMNILLVDDNLPTLASMAKYLRDDGHQVHAADGYQSALDLSRREKFGLAICDINLADGDGCDLLRELRQMQPIRAIAVTGYTLPQETEHYRDAGFAAVLHKPVHHRQISAAISLLAQEALAGQTASLSA